MFGLGKSSMIVTIIIIIVVVMLSIGSFFVAYKFYLHKWLGKWLNGPMSKIPLIGGWLVPGEGYNSNLVSSIAQITNARVNAELGTRTTKAKGHGRACAWDSRLCNVWEHSGLNKIDAGESDSGTIRNEKAIELRASQYQKLQEPARRKVLYGSFNIGGNLRQAPGTFQDVINQHKTVMNKAKAQLSPQENGGIKNGSEIKNNINNLPSY